jgi:hypothetical protein
VNAKGKPDCVEIYRSGSALWVVIDGKPLPMGWVTRAYVAVDDDDLPYVDITIKADRVIIDNSMYVIDRGGRDGEAEGEDAQEAEVERVRLSEDEALSHP